MVDYNDKMQKAIDALGTEFASIRAGRANPHVLDLMHVLLWLLHGKQRWLRISRRLSLIQILESHLTTMERVLSLTSLNLQRKDVRNLLRISRRRLRQLRLL